MDTVSIVAIVVGLAVVGLVAWYLVQRRRTEELRARYGPEYSRTVSEAGDRRRAEAELLKRQERVEHLDIRPLTAEQRDRFLEQWRAVQAKFVDDPKGAVTDADRLVEEVMKTRGYPVADFDQRAADLSVHHPRVVENYRAARDIAIRHRRGEASTEDLRQAMVYNRELVQDLLEDREHAAERAKERAVDRAAGREEGRAERAARPERGDERVTRPDREVRP